MKKIFIEKNLQYLRVSMVAQGGELSLFMIEKDDGNPKVGEIYLGVIESMVPRIESYFVNIGKDRNCILPFKKSHKNLKIGDYIIVEILKEELNEKCAKVTSKYSLGGDAIVLTLGTGKIFYSSKIRDINFKKKTKSLIKPQNMDIVYRSKAEILRENELLKEYGALKEKLTSIAKKGEYSNRKCLLYRSHGILKELLSILNFEEKNEIILNDKEIQSFFQEYKLDLKDEYKQNLSLSYIEDECLFNKFSIEDKILELIDNKVLTKSEGNIVIDRTEAMTLIDVNSGREGFNGAIVGKNNINYESAEIIPEEIIKRNISGIIIVDFVNTKSEKEKEKIIKILKHGFKNDRNKVNIYDFTELGLVQIVRERRGKSAYEYLISDYSGKLIRYEKLDFNYLLFYIRNKLKSLYIISEEDYIYIEVPSYYELEFTNLKDYISSYLNCKKANIYIDFKEEFHDINIKRIYLNEEKKSMSGMKF